MAEYRFLLANGKTLVLEGDQPPSHEEAAQEAQAAGMQLAPDTGPQMAGAQEMPPSQAAAPPAMERMTPQPPSVDDAAAPEGNMGGGMLTGGYLTRKAGEMLPAVVHKAGEMMYSGKGRLTKALSGAVGAATGAGVGSSLGPVGAYGGFGLGAEGGRQVAKKFLIPGQKTVGKALKFISETGFPEDIYAGQGMKTLARKGLQGTASKVLPGIGNAMMTIDAAKMVYDKLKGIPGAIRENPNMLAASPGYQTPEDERIMRLLAGQP
jgi:hypothetical protein